MRKKVIAIFEDDPVNRFVYERTLKAFEQIEFYIFDNAEAGIALAKEINFEVVFIEIHFWGDFHGISILNKLKETCDDNTVFIAMTSFLQKGDLEKILSSGFTLCMEKPIVFSNMDFSGTLEERE